MSRTAVVACGALAVGVQSIARRRGWDIDVHPLPALLHNRPQEIAPAIATELDRLADRYDRVAVAYADCGSYGAIGEVARERGVAMLSGEHCYDVFALDEVKQALGEQPGTYFLTDFLARTFEHTVVRPLGLDRHPELRDDYFGSYTRVVWLAQRRTPGAERAALRAASRLGLPLEIRSVGDVGLERELERVLNGSNEERSEAGAVSSLC
jgi:hypothetical protein